MNFIDLFAGAGGLSEGFIRLGFCPIAHVEMDKAASFSLKTRAGYHFLKKSGDISLYNSYLKGELSREELYKNIPEEFLNSVINCPIGSETNAEIYSLIQSRLMGKKVDVIIGGPPCQAYSLAGRARSLTGMEGDPRNYLFLEYASYLEKYKPRMFVFENVIGLKSAAGGKYLLEMKQIFNQIGYQFEILNVEANKFGVLQNRRRLIIIGWRKRLIDIVPELIPQPQKKGEQVFSVFGDLPPLIAGSGTNKFSIYKKPANTYLRNSGIRTKYGVLTQHVARPHSKQDLNIYKMVVEKWNSQQARLQYKDLPECLKSHNNRDSFNDRFKIVAGNLHSAQTIVAHIAKDGHYYIHPDIEQNRSISVREAARLQSFPDDYYFEGTQDKFSRTAAFRQIGNAVPPLLAEKIAATVKKILT